MKPQEMENRVKEIFERQGFEVEESPIGFEAGKEDDIKQIQVFSSEKFSEEKVMSSISGDSIVFIDEDLSNIENNVSNQVSVLREREEVDIDTPSYEMIGDIAVINELSDMSEEEAVEAIRHFEKSVETILLKEDGLSGEFRVGNYKKLFGEETETVHKEFGCRFKVDPTEVYYSERFSTERNRVVSQIQKGERVLVMFAGVGPYAVMAARNAEPEKVVAVEKNPAACEYLKKNIELNSVEETFEACCGDVKDIVPDLGEFDRIIMPLPETAEEFLDLALDKIADGGIIHFYSFVAEGEEDKILEMFEDSEYSFELLDSTVCGNKGPGIERKCYDIKVSNL